jgi:hypothetical protein
MTIYKHTYLADGIDAPNRPQFNLFNLPSQPTTAILAEIAETGNTGIFNYQARVEPGSQ